MKKTTKILLWSAFAVASVSASAQTGRLSVVAKDADGQIVAEAPVSMESRLIFSDKGVEVMNGEQLQTVFNYRGKHSIAFSYDQLSVIESASTDCPLLLLQNPVSEFLEFKAYPADPASLTITDINGAVRYNAMDWNGEPVNVGYLAPGLYLVTVDNVTLKFIKK